MANLLLDEDVDVRLAEYLTRLGHDVVTVSGLGMWSTPDHDVLLFAAQANRAVVTRNRNDFYALHAASANPAGIVVIRSANNIQQLAERIDRRVRREEPLTGKIFQVQTVD